MKDVAELTELENFEEMVAEFEQIYRRSLKTKKFYRSRFTKWKNYLQEQRGIAIFEANGDDVQSYADWLTPQLTPQVKRQYLRALKVLYDFLINKRVFLGNNPYNEYVDNLDQFDQTNAKYDRSIELTPQKDKWNDDEIELLLDNAPKLMHVPYLVPAIDAAVNTGIRIDGIGKLTLEKFKKDELNGQWYIQLTKKGLIHEENDVKTHSQKVPVPESFLERMRQYVAQRNKDFAKRGIELSESLQTHVFLSNRGNTINGDDISHKFTILARKLFPASVLESRKLTIHCLRKSFGTRKLKEGFSLHEVSKMLGHSRISTTQVYLKMSDQEVLDAYAEKSKDQDLDYLSQLEEEKKTRKVQKSQEEIASDLEVVDADLREVKKALIDGIGNQTHLRIREEELTFERDALAKQILTPREQDLLEEREQLLKRIQSLEDQLQYANSKMKELPNYKLFEKKTKKSLKQQMHERALELQNSGLGYGKIADAINEEFNTAFSRYTIKYWLKPKN